MSIKIIGRVKLIFGNVKFISKNLVVGSGINLITKLLTGQVSLPSSFQIAIGSGTTQENINDTSLESEITRKDANKNITTTNITNDTIIFDTEFILSSIYNISEVGLFIDNNLFSRKVTGNYNNEVNQRLKIIWELLVRNED